MLVGKQYDKDEEVADLLKELEKLSKEVKRYFIQGGKEWGYNTTKNDITEQELDGEYLN